MRLTSTLLLGRDNDQYFMLDPASPTHDTLASADVGVLDKHGHVVCGKPVDGKKRWTHANKPRLREQERDKKRTSWLGISIRRKPKHHPSEQSAASGCTVGAHAMESNDGHGMSGGTAGHRSEASLAGTFGVPNYLADTCIEAGPYILDLSTNWQDVSPAISSNGFARAVRTLSRVPNAAIDRTSSVIDLWSGPSTDDAVQSTAENELQARAIFMATRVIQTFPAIYERVHSTEGAGQRGTPPMVIPAESAIAQLTEQVALRLYTLWTCSPDDTGNGAGRAVGRVLSPLVLNRLRQSVETILNRGGLSLRTAAAAAMSTTASPPDSAASDSFSFDSSLASSSSSLTQLSGHPPSQPALQQLHPLALPSSSSSTTMTTSASPVIRPTASSKPAAHEAEYAVRTSLQHVFGDHLSSARKSQLMERARATLERCLASERRLSPGERQSMYRFQRLQSPISWETVHWRFVMEE